MDNAIRQIKGGGDSHHSLMMKRALGCKEQDTEEVDRRGGRGTIEPKQKKRQPKAYEPNRGANTDWSHDSNRINLGVTYMKSASSVDADYEDRGHVDETRIKLDAMEDGRLDGLSDEEEFGEIEDDAVAKWRAARVAELKKTTSKTNEFISLGHGSYTEIVQDDFLKEVTKSKYVVCHFYHPEYERCKLIDKHLTSLARKHLATKWVKIDANKSPFFVQKLQIKMLPTLIFFKDGIARDRMIGLDDLGATDEFTTEQLEKRIEKAGVIITGDKIDQEELANQRKTANSIRQSNHNMESDSDEDD